MKLARDAEDVHPPLAAYVHQIELRGAERLLVLSGQVGVRPDGSLPGDPIEQLDVAWDNLDRNLRAAGMGTDDLVKVTLYLVGDIDPGARREVIARHLGDHRPCMTLVVPAALATPEIRVELDAWASRGDD
jgi:enamine deaminase RidA (YjgF/YER057c/UK114 family)